MISLLVVAFITGFAEKLFQKLEKLNECFEVKLMHLNLISRLIGLHELLLLPYYPYLQRFLQPHQRGECLLDFTVLRIQSFVVVKPHRLLDLIFRGSPPANVCCPSHAPYGAARRW